MISFTNTAKKAFYIKSISITYTDAVASIEKPTITVTDGSADADGFYENNLQLTLACATEGATICYTLDGTEPTATSAEYTTALTFTNEFVTLQAKAFKGEDISYAATAQYYHKSTADLPYSTTEALKLYADKGAAADVYVAGTVTEAKPYTTSKTTNYTITDGTNTLYVYKGKADAASGLEDILTLVEGDKVVVKGTMATYNQASQIGEGSTIVKWTENTNPVLTVLKDALDFGSISMYATAPKKTITVTGKNLTEDIAVTLSDNAAFMVDKTTLPATGDEIVVTPNMEELGENTATLTLSSGEKSVVVSLKSEILHANLISWSVNGKVTATTEVIDGETLVLPTDPETPSACSAKTFMGWATTASVAADGEDITYVDAKTVPTADVTYYAVFAQENETGNIINAYEKLQATDNKYTISNGVYLLVAQSKGTSYAYAGKVKDKNIGDYVEVSVKDGLITNKPETAVELTITITDETTGKFSIYDGTYWWSAPNKNEITFNSTETDGKDAWVISEKYGSINSVSQSERWIQFNSTSGQERFATYKDGSQTYAYLYKKTAHSEISYSDYATLCNGTATDTQDAIAPNAQTVVKTIENGQLVITIDGTRYNAQGQVIE